MCCKIMFFLILHIFLICAFTNGIKLDLSWKGLTKEKFFRDPNGTVSNRIEKATEINLRGNNFDSFLDCSANLDKLEVLDLSQNKLETFYFLCREEDHLYSLNVSHNKLTFLNDTALTDRVTKLLVLDLSYNMIEVITRNTFQHLKNLHYLSMGTNPIGDNIDEDAFRNLKMLAKLYMNNIGTRNFPNGLLTPLINLRHLSLSENPLDEIPALPASIETLDLSGTNIIHLKNLDLPSLRGLALNSMPRLETLDFNDLKNLKNLTTLSIENSTKLKNFTATTPPSEDLLPILVKISIKNCSIDKIDHDLQPIMQKTKQLDLQDNPWNCDCEIKWMLSLKSTINYRDHLRCKTPSEHLNKRIYEIPADEFHCDGINYLALWLALGILGFTCIVIGVAYFTLEPIRRFRARSIRGDTISYKNITANSNNDTEKILDQSDITDCA